jgi:hypothetical protein
LGGGGAGDQQQIAPGGNGGLVMAKDFAKPTLGAIAQGGVTHGRRGRDNAHARTSDRRSHRIAAFPPNGKSPAIEPAAAFADRSDFARATQMLLSAKSHVTPSRQEQSNDRQALATLGATSLDDLAAALGRHAGAVTDLASTFLAVRAECGFHDVEKKRGSEMPERHPGCQGRGLAANPPHFGAFSQRDWPAARRNFMLKHGRSGAGGNFGELQPTNGAKSAGELNGRTRRRLHFLRRIDDETSGTRAGELLTYSGDAHRGFGGHA